MSAVKKRLIVHIGIHKTGSTAIQHTLFNNARQLAAHGILYPRYHAAPVGDFNHRQLAWEIEAGAVDLAALRNWAKYLAQTDAHTVVLSAEDLCKLKDVEFLGSFADCFETEILVYL